MHTVLFVDDDPAVLSGFNRSFHQLEVPWRSIMVNDARSARRILSRESVDVLVTDLRMPLLDGTVLLRHLREDSPGTAAIVVSGHLDADMRSHLIDANIDFLDKPCEPEAMVYAIEQSLEEAVLQRAKLALLQTWAATGETKPERRPHILFVDDDPEILSSLQRALKCQQRVWNMIFVCGGRRALDVIANEAIDVLVTDMAMPLISGHELLARTTEIDPSIETIFLSGRCGGEEINALTDKGIIYLGKPASGRVIITAIQDALDFRSIKSRD